MTRVHRRPPIDILRGDEGALILYDNDLIQISLLGLALYDLAAEGVDLDELPDLLVARVGHPGDDSVIELTTAAVDALVARGVLTTTEA